jgi:VanZ family protein
MTPIQHKFHHALILLYATIIAALSLLPAEEAINLDIWDKAQHFVAYAVFMLLALPIGNTHKARPKYALGIIGFSVFIELAQQFSPGRDTSAEDAIANSLGVMSGYLIGWLVLKFFQGRGDQAAI